MPILSKFKSRGNIELLSRKRVALFASRKTPAEIYPAASGLFHVICNLPLCLGGGWQAPLERKLLKLLPGIPRAGLIYYSATDIGERVLNPKLQKIFDAEKLLLLCAEAAPGRASRSAVDKRDQLLFSQITRIIFFHIAPKGRLESVFNTLLHNNNTPFVLDHPLNEPFLNAGGLAINEDNAQDLLLI